MTKAIIVDALKQIQRRNRSGKLLPSAVVQAARNPDNPLHDKFCWDDTKAATEYRIWQARQLIASIEVIYDGPEEKSPCFVSLKSDRKDGGYRSVSDVLSDRKLHAEMIRTVIEELKSMQDRYARFKELQPVWKATARVEKRVRRKAA